MSRNPNYLQRKIPQSAKEAVAKYSTDSIKTIVKASVQKYIESFMDVKGGNRNLFEAITREGLKYIISESFDQKVDDDQRKLQVARLFDGLRQELPAIIIFDGGFNFVPTNWTGMDAVSSDQDYVYHRISIMRTLSLSIVGGTRDRASADMLHSLLSLLFGELQFKAGGTRITGNVTEGENWVVCLCQPNLGSVTSSLVQDDPKDSLYTFTLELPEVMFEDHILIKEPRPEIPFFNEGIANPEGGLANVIPEIIVPDQIKINRPTEIHFKLLQPKFHTFRVSDPNICTLEPREGILYPRRLGEFDLQVMRPTKDLQNKTNSMEVVTSKRVKVVP